MPDRLTITVRTRGLPDAAPGDGMAAFLEALGEEMVDVVQKARPLPRRPGSGRFASSLHVEVDFNRSAVRTFTEGVPYGAFVRRKGDDARYRLAKDPAKSVTIDTEFAREMRKRGVDLVERLPGNVWATMLAESFAAAGIRETRQLEARRARNLKRRLKRAAKRML